LILFTGANTPFTGFPFLANFVAEDSFLPRQLTRRGHRLAFSNGIIVLTLLSMVLLVVGKANVDKLVPFYALGVFTGFTLAGFGMAKYHTIHKQQGWKHKFWINAAGGAMSLAIVIITAIVQVGTTAGKSLEAQVFDETGGIRLLFFGRTRIPGIEPGSTVRVTGTVGEYKGHLALANPRYELLAPEPAPPVDARTGPFWRARQPSPMLSEPSNGAKLERLLSGTPSSSSGLGRWPFTPVTRVRIPLGVRSKVSQVAGGSPRATHEAP